MNSSSCKSSLTHQTVLLKEAVDGLNISPAGIYVDATFGRGGHSKEILSRLNSEGRLIAMDRDPSAVDCGRELSDKRISLYHSKFSGLPNVLKNLKVNKIHGILFDLGVSSPQLDNPDRGFSLQNEGPLDMRMDFSKGLTAHDWLQEASSTEIRNVLSKFGEESFSERIANEIVSRRNYKGTDLSKKFPTNTRELAKLVQKASAIGSKFVTTRTHPATRTFQAIRIFVNNELDELKKTLDRVPEFLFEKGRLSVISFHSLEHRIVKFAMNNSKEASKHHSMKDHPRRLGFFREDYVSRKEYEIKEVKKLKPSTKETSINPRSRSALLRVGELVRNKIFES